MKRWSDLLRYGTRQLDEATGAEQKARDLGLLVVVELGYGSGDGGECAACRSGPRAIAWSWSAITPRLGRGWCGGLGVGLRGALRRRNHGECSQQQRAAEKSRAESHEEINLRILNKHCEHQTRGVRFATPPCVFAVRLPDILFIKRIHRRKRFLTRAAPKRIRLLTRAVLCWSFHAVSHAALFLQQLPGDH